MLTMNRAEQFFRLSPPLLTAYLRTGPAKTEAAAEQIAWLKDEGRSMGKTISAPERRLFLQQVERVESYLQQYASHEKSLVIFAGPEVWVTAPLQLEVQPELSWGKPALSQLVWLASEHKPYGIVAVDHAGAFFFHYWFGQIVESEEKSFTINTSQWKRKLLGHASRQGVRKTRGSQRDVFEKRLENRYMRLCQTTAQQAAEFCATRHLAAVFVAGPDKLIKQIKATFPVSFREPIVLVKQDLARVTHAELLKHLEPHIASWEQGREASLVAATATGRPDAIVGFDEVLHQLQKGKIRTLVIARGLEAALHQCVRCGWTDRSGDPVCVVCGGPRRTTTLRSVLPDLVHTHQVDLEVVSGEAAERLNGMEGMAAWLGEPERVAARAGR